MADFTVVPGNVLASGAARISQGVAGVSITAGQCLAQDVDGTMKLCDANAAAPLQTLKGISLHASLTGQPILYVTSDPAFAPGFTVNAGDSLIVSANPGMLCPDADKTTGWFVTDIGVGIGGNKIKFQPLASGVAR